MKHFKVYLLLYTNLFFIHYSYAFNITNILNRHPSFSTFNRYLSETDLATEINQHEKITVFAVGNNAISRLSGKPHDVLENILKVHVVVGYYDVEKLRKLANQTGQMTTLFQTTGLAIGQQGFLKASVVKGNVFIGSATKEPGLGALLVRSVACEPCNLSVISISTVIIPDGILGSSSPVEPPVRSPNKAPVQPAPPQAYSPKLDPPASPKMAPPYAKLAPPFAKLAPVTTPSESPADAPAYSRESPPKPTNPPPRPPTKPTGPPDTSACENSSNIGTGLYISLTILLSSIWNV